MRMPRNFSQKTYSIVVVVIALGLLWLVVYPLGVMVWRVFVLSGSWLDAFRKVIHNPALARHCWTR
jgi:hypothetical protein